MGFGDTIFALSSGAPPAGVAVIRISGPAAREALRTVAGGLPQPRVASLRSLRNRKGELLDRGLVLFFPGPESFTGEDCGELHVHGGAAVIAAFLAELGTMGGLRAAEAGEFTRRAFANGKLDLTEAEALSDLLEAQTEAQRRFAIANGSGRNASLYASWRQRLLVVRARIEALLDFSEEEDVATADTGGFVDDIERLRSEILRHSAAFRQAEIVRSGFQVVILGAPNAGKSSLLNALAAREAAIVTEEAGTTRDLIVVDLDIDGSKVVITDTAGIRETPGAVERIGIERARAAADTADLIILLSDISRPQPVAVPGERPLWRVGSKLDLAGSCAKRDMNADYDLCVSAMSGDGISDLLARLGQAARAAGAVPGPMPFRERHVAILSRCAGHLQVGGASGLTLEVRAEELRLAGDELARITGAIGTEEMLGEIFSSFCIGK